MCETKSTTESGPQSTRACSLGSRGSMADSILQPSGRWTVEVPLIAELEKRVASLEQELRGNFLKQHESFTALERKAETQASELEAMREMLQQNRDEIDTISLTLKKSSRLSTTGRFSHAIYGDDDELTEHSVMRRMSSNGSSKGFFATQMQKMGDLLEHTVLGKVIDASKYKRIDQDVADFETMVEDRKCSRKNYEWALEWLTVAENGELDVYTCLGLSNAFTLSTDTRRILGKIIGVICLQLIVPVLLLTMEVTQGVSFRPRESMWSFRIMGASLFIYAVYSMYHNALDLCRYRALQWLLANQADSGYWWPLMVGEFLNVFVSLILVITLFVVFTTVRSPVNLILNSVAVNFLGAVDAELVDDDMRMEAQRNFKFLFLEYGADISQTRHSVISGNRSAFSLVLNFLMALIVISGGVLTVVFLLAPSRGTATPEIGN